MNVTPTQIQTPVAKLNNLHEIFRGQGEILSCGKEAVEPLATLLLSEPSTFPGPRVAAQSVGALSEEIGPCTFSFVFSTTMICWV